jgi:glutaredoxin
MDTKGFFIYSKSDCKYCVQVKKLLDLIGMHYNSKECVFESEEEKQEFLNMIKEKNNGKVWNTFPMVFHDGNFIGGYKETGVYLEKMNAFNDSDF